MGNRSCRSFFRVLLSPRSATVVQCRDIEGHEGPHYFSAVWVDSDEFAHKLEYEDPGAPVDRGDSAAADATVTVKNVSVVSAIQTAETNRFRYALAVINQLESCAARALREPGHVQALSLVNVGTVMVSVSRDFT